MKVGEMCLSCLLLIRNDRVNKSITNFSQEYGNSVRAPLRNRFSDLIICPLLRMVNFIQTEVGIISIGRKKTNTAIEGEMPKSFLYDARHCHIEAPLLIARENLFSENVRLFIRRLHQYAGLQPKQCVLIQNVFCESLQLFILDYL